MSLTVCLAAKTLHYPEGGGHVWVYLNWALGLRALGCEVIWLDAAETGTPAHRIREQAEALKLRLRPYGLADSLALCLRDGAPLPPGAGVGCLDLEGAAAADLLLNLRYDLAPGVVGRFARSALVDIDPGLLQVWMSTGQIVVAPHHVYFTTGETVGRPEARFPDAGLRWHYTPPCVALGRWRVRTAAGDAPFTTVSHWSAPIEWVVDDRDSYANDKRAGFLPFLDLPAHTAEALELALCLKADGPGRLVPFDEGERDSLLRRGWRVRSAQDVASTPWGYQAYIQASRGEFSCAKPSCARLQNAWVSDRTLCYLASGKPAVVRHTGPSRFLPDSDGLFRFHTVEDAARCLASASADYEHHCRRARALAEEHFDARRVVGRVLEQAWV